MKNLVITCGLPRSGKSTYVLNHFKFPFKIINIDKLRLEFTDSIYIEDLEPYIWDIARDRATIELFKDNPVVIDECNTYIKNILFWHKITYWIPDIEVTLLHFTTSVNTCLSRTENKVLKSVIERKSKSNIKKSDLINLCNTYKMNYKEVC